MDSQLIHAVYNITQKNQNPLISIEIFFFIHSMEYYFQVSQGSLIVKFKKLRTK